MAIRLEGKPGKGFSTDSSLLLTEEPRAATPPSSRRRTLLKVLLVYFVAVFGADVWARSGEAVMDRVHRHGHGHHHGHKHGHSGQAVSCPAQGKALLKGTKWEVPGNYSKVVADRLSRAVQVPTVSYDDMGPVGEDSRWEVHAKFNSFLESEYPGIYSNLTHELVHTYAHLYTWEGSNSALQPLLLMAHQDVVPVLPATLDLWDHPPFAGVVDDKWIHGRGAGDCKNQLLGTLNAVEKLVAEGFRPERTILIAFGFDEEIGGSQGAGWLAREIVKRYGADSLSLMVDEGFGGVDETYGAKVASLGMAEKGAINFKITVETPGGHSSVPPEHTGIGYISQILVDMEANPFPIALKPEEPYLKYLTCLAEHAPDLPKDLKKAVKNPKKWKKLARKLAKESPLARAFMGTTQAIDILNAGVKVNALPEVATAVVNHRIAFTSSVEETKTHINNIIEPLARKWGFSYEAFNQSVLARTTKGSRHVKLEIQGNGRDGPEGLEPAPITPAKGGAFDLMAGTIKGVFGEETVVAPSGMHANTDTRHYWSLSRNIYRFIPGPVAGFRNVHTVNEAISIDAHVSTIQFFYTLLQNTQGWRHGNEQ